jgi:hypothetical protein
MNAKERKLLLLMNLSDISIYLQKTTYEWFFVCTILFGIKL